MDMSLFKESISDYTTRMRESYREGILSRKKVMVIGTYHLGMTPEYKKILKPLVDKMVKFAKVKGTEVRFELELPHPMVDERLTDAFLYHSIENACDVSIKGFDDDSVIEKLNPKLNELMRQSNKCIVDACATFGIEKDDAYHALDSFYTNKALDKIVELLKTQNLTELDKMIKSFINIDNVIGRALAFADRDYYVDERPNDIIARYNAICDEMDEVLLRRDRNWELPDADRVLICVGYEHVKFVADVYRKKGYTILK